MRKKPIDLTNEDDWKRFNTWADDYGTGDHIDDWLPWWNCWIEGYKSALMDMNKAEE